MRNTNWRPIIMICLMLSFMLVIGLGYLISGFSQYQPTGSQMSPEAWRSGVWGMWGMGRMLMRFLFMGFGLLVLMLLVRLFFGGMSRHDRVWDRGGPMGWMSDRYTCQECNSLIRANWKVCPHCGSGIQDRELEK
jgi:hypothetical protein